MKSSSFIVIVFALLITNTAFAQTAKVTVSGQIKDATNKSVLAFVNVTLTKDSNLVAGTITGDNGRFSLTDIKTGHYILTCTYTGYLPKTQPVNVGELSNFLELGIIELTPNEKYLNEVTVTGKQDAVSARLDKK